MRARLPAISLSFAVTFSLVAPSRAREDKDEGPLEVLSSDELAPPVLVCSPGRLSVTASEDVVKTFRITIKNAGGRVLHWSVASAPAWAVPEARSGKAGFRGKEDVVFRIDSTRLKRGTTRGEIVIEAPGAKGSPARIPIRVTYTAKPKERPRDRRRPEPPAVRRPVSTGTRHWRWSYGVPLVGGLAGVATEGGGTYAWNPGPIASFEKHWGSHAQHSLTISFLRYTEPFYYYDGYRRLWYSSYGSYLEKGRITYRRYFGAQRTEAVFLELGVALGELEARGSTLFSDDHYEETHLEPLLGLGVRFRGREGTSAWFADLSLGVIPKVEVVHELLRESESVSVYTLSLMFGWSTR